MAVRYLTKEQIVQKLGDLARVGWVKSLRPLNAGGIGNTIDASLGLPENNLPIADTAQWELKTHRVGSSSLLTLFHMEPQPREFRVVVKRLLPIYGWADQSRPGELSFRQTIQATHTSDRGFGITVDRSAERVLVYFNRLQIDARHASWLNEVDSRGGLGQLEPQPYWTFKDLFLKASTKLLNAFFVEAEARKDQGDEYFRLNRLLVLQSLDLNRFVGALENGAILIDFDARSHHNHGTKFRIRQDSIPGVYRYVDTIDWQPHT
jgi:hypothetical protein